MRTSFRPGRCRSEPTGSRQPPSPAARCRLRVAGVVNAVVAVGGVVAGGKAGKVDAVGGVGGVDWRSVDP